MKKEFTLKNYFVYVCRYWLVTAICAVVGLGAMLAYGLISRPAESVTYEGSVTVAGIGSFFEADSLGEITESQANIYGTIRETALTLMSSQSMSDEIYKELEQEWKELNPRLSKSRAPTEFFKALSVKRSGYYVNVSFTQTNTDDKHNAFSAKVVDGYITHARSAAIKNDTILNSDKLPSVEARLKLDEEVSESRGILLNCVVGLAVGIVLGLVIMFVVYFVDRRINSYGDIAAVTGGRLLGISRTSTGEEVSPQIESAMNGAKTLFAVGGKKASSNVSRNYARYCATAGFKTLLVDFGRDGEDTFGEYLGGKALGDCTAEEDGYSLLCGGKSFARAAKETERMEVLKKAYEKIVLCAPYRGDGSSSALSAVSDKVVFAVDQNVTRLKDVLETAYEANAGERAIGAVIDNAGKSFVGEKTFFAETEEE